MKRLVIVDESDEWQSQDYWGQVAGVIAQLQCEYEVYSPSTWPNADLRDSLVVTLGKKALELVIGGEKVKNYVKEEVGKERTINDCPLIVQYHPLYYIRQLQEKGGASEKTISLWFDIWDSVQAMLSGTEEPEPDVALLTDYNQITSLLDFVWEQGILPIYDYETRGDVDARRPELCSQFDILTIGVAFEWEGQDVGVAFPLDHDAMPEMLRPGIVERWQRIVERGGTAHNARYEHKCNLKRFGVSGPLEDTMLKDNALDELATHSLERLLVRCKCPFASYKRRATQVRLNPADQPLDVLLKYNALDGLGTLWCNRVLDRKLAKQHLEHIARDDERVSRNLAEVEMDGIRASLEVTAATIAEFQQTLRVEQAELRQMDEVQRTEEWATQNIKSKKKGAVFNSKSFPMMKHLLMDELRIPIEPVKKKGKKQLSFDKKVLEPFETDYPVVARINRIRSLSSMLDGFLKNWGSFIGPDGNVHSQFNQADVITGRLSSSKPPLQNMPKRSYGAQVRRVFCSRFVDGVLIEGDFIQQEPRLIAGWSGDKTMIKQIMDGVDLHGYVASQIFNVPYEGKDTKYRDEFGKRMNLGIQYGQTEYGLAEKTKISLERAVELLAMYAELFPGVQAWRESKHREAVEFGYVTDLFGARRHLPGARSSSKYEVARALRQAGNFPIQSTANRFTLYSLVCAKDMVKAAGYQDRIVVCSTVHDSVAMDSAPEAVDVAVEIMRAAMTFHNDQPYWKDRGVPMAVEMKIGYNLFDTEMLELAA